MMHKLILSILLLSSGWQAGATEMNSLLVQDCYQEWLSRGWTVGEDETLASDLENFRDGIVLFCEVRSELFTENKDISPYIQETMREIAPFVLTASKEDIRAYILMIEDSGRTSPRDPYLRP